MHKRLLRGSPGNLTSSRIAQLRRVERKILLVREVEGRYLGEVAEPGTRGQSRSVEEWPNSAAGGLANIRPSQAIYPGRRQHTDTNRPTS